MVKISTIMLPNNYSNINKSIESILNQTIEDIEILCINNISNNYSSNIINKYVQSHKNIKMINEEKDFAKTINNCINSASGTYISFLDYENEYSDRESLNVMYELGINHDANIVGSKSNIDRDNDTNSSKDYEIVSSENFSSNLSIFENIYKKSFLIENRIEFSESTINDYSSFLIKVLTNTDKIIVSNSVLCCPNELKHNRYDTYESKKEYILNFLNNFNTLKNNNLQKLLSLYKIKLIDYLNYNQNIYDTDLIRIITDNPQIIDYFDKKEYGYNILTMMNGPSDEYKAEYGLIKDCLFEEMLINNMYIDSNMLKNFIKLSQQYSTDDNYSKTSYKQLKEIEKNILKEEEIANHKVDTLKKEVEYNQKINNNILNSNSWKLTKFLRKNSKELILDNDSSISDENQNNNYTKNQKTNYNDIDENELLKNKLSNHIDNYYQSTLNNKKRLFSTIKEEFIEIISDCNNEKSIKLLGNGHRKFFEGILVSENVEEFELLQKIIQKSNKIIKLKDEEENLEKNNTRIIDVNNKLLSSKSWKMTKFLRIKDVIRTLKTKQ